MKKFLWNKDIRYLILGISLLFVFAKTVHAQEAVEIPGPEIKDSSFVQVKDLNIGDVVFVKSETGELIPNTITKLQYQQEPVEVYNLSVAGEETFFANDFAVHNKAGIDDVKPVCRVIVNPTISDHISGSVLNRSFETGQPGACPPNKWLECNSGSPVVRNGTVPWCTDCGSKSVRVSWPNASVWQNVSSSYVKQWNRYLYEITAYGRGTSPTIQFGSEDALQRKCSATIYNPSGGWSKRGLLAWARGSGDQILKLYIEKANEGNWADFDLVEFQELEGLASGATVNDLDVNLYVAYADNRIVTQLRHWNEGTGAPAWDSGDPRVIWFGLNVNGSEDPIVHTLRTGGGDEKTVNVQVRDWAGNVSDTCSWTVNYVQPTGTITGNVYQNLGGQCSRQDSPEGTGTGWTVQCQVSGQWINVHKDSNSQFTCCADVGCSSYQLPQGVTYPIKLIPPTDWLATGCSGTLHSVTLNSSQKTMEDPFYIWQGANAWFQTQGGDVHAVGDIKSPIPLTATNKNFCMDLDNYPGLISYGGSSADFSPANEVSSKGWLANDSLTLSSGYDSFYPKLGSPTVDNFDGEVDQITEDGTYYSENEVTINNNWDFPSGRKAIILINGNLEISKEIHVPVGSFLAFIVSGNIGIKGSSVGDKSASVGTPHLQGVFLADGTLNTNSDGDSSGKRLVGAGIFYAKGGFNLRRELKQGGISDDTTPAELFIARPDLFINIPEELKTSYFFEQEVAP